MDDEMSLYDGNTEASFCQALNKMDSADFSVSKRSVNDNMDSLTFSRQSSIFVE